MADPYFQQMKELEASQTPPPGRRLPGTGRSEHIWQAPLPADAPTGTHLLQVRTRDMFGHEHIGDRVIRIH